LESIALAHTGTLFQACPQLTSAVAQLKNLRSISLSRLNHYAFALLQNMRSPLARVFLGCNTRSGAFPAMSSAVKENLTALHLRRYHFSRLTSAGVQYSAVRTLEMEAAHLSDLGFIPQLFPNVLRLSISSFGGGVVENVEAEEQHRMHLAQYRASYPWNRLAHVSGDLKTLYILAFLHQIRRIDIHELWIPEARSHGWLSSVITAAQPTHLSLDLVHPRLNPTHSTLAGLLTAAPQLTHLRLAFNWLIPEKLNMEEFLEQLIGMIRPLSLKHLHLILQRPVGRRTHPVVSFLLETDLGFFARRIVDGAPTLQLLSVHMWQRCAHFVVSRSSITGQVSLRKINGASARDLLESEWRVV